MLDLKEGDGYIHAVKIRRNQDAYMGCSCIHGTQVLEKEFLAGRTVPELLWQNMQ